MIMDVSDTKPKKPKTVPVGKEIGDTALEMKAIPFFVDKIETPAGRETIPDEDNDGTVTEQVSDDLTDAFNHANFDDDDDTATVDADFDDYTDVTNPDSIDDES